MKRAGWRSWMGLLGLAAGIAAPAADSPATRWAELKVCDRAGQPWRMAREDWAGARQRVSSDPARREGLCLETAGRRAEFTTTWVPLDPS